MTHYHYSVYSINSSNKIYYGQKNITGATCLLTGKFGGKESQNHKTLKSEKHLVSLLEESGRSTFFVAFAYCGHMHVDQWNV